ncbi:MAG: hypothetical protein HQK97_04040 [Nitrospirae bacterium]|nr:hypothetical protein [Nitrospirota bacterium]
MNYFLIASLRRCGSTFLQAALDSYEDMFCQYEHVKRDKKFLRVSHVAIDGAAFSFIKSIEKLAEGSYAGRQFKGSKVTFNDYEAIGNIEEALDCVVRDRIKLIHITRPLHEQFVSVQVARATGVWNIVNSKDDKVMEYLHGEQAQWHVDMTDKLRPGMFTVNIEEIESFCQKIDTVDRLISAVKKAVPYYHAKCEYLAERVGDIVHFITGSNTPRNVIKQQNMGRNIKTEHKSLISNWSEAAHIFDKWEKSRDYRRLEGVLT